MPRYIWASFLAIETESKEAASAIIRDLCPGEDWVEAFDGVEVWFDAAEPQEIVATDQEQDIADAFAEDARRAYRRMWGCDPAVCGGSGIDGGTP